MIALRKFLFYCFLLIYVVLCPLMIFYALGYIYSPDVDRGVIKTGMIHVQSLPSKARILLNKKDPGGVTPLTVGDLMPGGYEVTVSFPGYQTWTKTVQVEAGKAVVLDQVLLIPDKLKEVVLMANGFDTIYPMADTRYLLLASGDRLRSWGLFDWSDELALPLFESSDVGGDERFVNLTSVPESDRLMFEVDHQGQKKFLWGSVSKNGAVFKDVTNLLASLHDPHLVWSSDDEDFVYGYSEHALSLVNLKEMAVYPNFIENIYGYGVSEGKVIALKNSSVLAADVSGRQKPMTVLEEAEFMKGLFDPEAEYRIYGISDDLTVMLGPKGEFLTNRLPYRFAEEGVIGFLFSKHAEKLLIWKKHELGILETSRAGRHRRFFEMGLQTDWVFRGGKAIAQAFWVNDGSYVLFRDQNQIYLVDVASGRDNAPIKILTVKPGSSVYYTDDTGKIYFLSATTGFLTSAQILPDERFLGRKIAMAIEGKAAELEKTVSSKTGGQ